MNKPLSPSKEKKARLWNIVYYMVAAVIIAATLLSAFRGRDNYVSETYGTTNDTQQNLEDGMEIRVDFKIPRNHFKGISVRFFAETKKQYGNETLLFYLRDNTSGTRISEYELDLNKTLPQVGNFIPLPFEESEGKEVSLYISGNNIRTAPAFCLSETANMKSELFVGSKHRRAYSLVFSAVYSEHQAVNMQALVGTFKQFNSTVLNGFKMSGATFDKDALKKYKDREFGDHGFILNVSELASVYHLPHTSVETPNIVWANSKTAEPPAKLPLLTGNPSFDENISAFGLTDFRGIKNQFGMYRRDRSRHIYIIGQTGSGKSGLLTLFGLSDIYHNQGYCIIDPHGDLAMDNLRFIPESRVKDVVYFNPADTQYPMAFNPLEVDDPTRKPNISSEVIGVLKRMFGDSWGPRLEHILRYTLLALLDRPNSTLLDISRMLTDTDFRKETLNYCQDVTVLQFWKKEFGSWSDKQVTESVAPVLNKVGAFTANPIVRNIIGQPKSSFNIRQIMDEGKILVVNLSKGLIGEDNAGLLGSFLVTKVQLAAMSRSDIENVEDRRPFYLYVDEFQNFATDSFSVILSEARKYGLNLTVANQYTSQMTESVRDAVFGNVGTTISFRVSADDAPVLAKQFEPIFEAQDLLNLNNRHFVVSMIINGEKVPAFSATTLSIPKPPHDITPQIIEYSREHYSRPRAEVEKDISANIGAADKFKQDLSNSGRAAGERGSAKQTSNEKPVFKFQPTPQQELRKQKISPNAMQGEEENAGNGLRDLGKLLAQKAATSSPNIKAVSSEVSEKEKGDTSVADEAAKRPVISSGNSRNKAKRRNNNRPKKTN